MCDICLERHPNTNYCSGACGCRCKVTYTFTTTEEVRQGGTPSEPDETPDA